MIDWNMEVSPASMCVVDGRVNKMITRREFLSVVVRAALHCMRAGLVRSRAGRKVILQSLLEHS